MRPEHALNWAILAFAVIMAVIVLAGCASDCTVKRDGYCYHVEGW